MITTIGVDWGFAGESTRIAVLESDAVGGTTVKHHENVCKPLQDTVAHVLGVVERYPGAEVVCDDGGRVTAATKMLTDFMPDRRITGLAPTTFMLAQARDKAISLGIACGTAWDTAIFLAVSAIPRMYKTPLTRDTNADDTA